MEERRVFSERVGRRARIAGQYSPPAVEVRPGEVAGAAERIDRLTGPLPGVDQVSPGLDPLGIVPGHPGVLRTRKTHRLPAVGRRHFTGQVRFFSCPAAGTR